METSSRTDNRRDLLKENLRQAIGVIRAHRMRSGLLILGVAIGITTILSIVTVMLGLVSKINKDLASSNRPYLVVARFDLFENPEKQEEYERRKKFEPEDAEILVESCPALDQVCYIVSQSEFQHILYYKAEHTPPVELDGSSHTFPEMFSIPIEYGRFFSEVELKRRERVVVLGYGPAQDLFPHEYPLGKFIKIGGMKYQVVGTFANREHFIGSISNNFAVIPYTAYYKDFQSKRDDPSIAANVRDGYTMDEAVEQVTNVLRVVRGRGPGEENDFHVVTSTAFIGVVSRVTLAISAILIVIASIGLIVGGIGVMNIMLISVAERTREIGVRMAIGASRRDIMQQFLMESATLTGIGGVVGTAFGLLAAVGIARQIHFPFQFSLTWTLIAVSFSVMIGVIFGIYPARRASRLHPVDALRYE
jgi:putative ABC transport system permease protein